MRNRFDRELDLLNTELIEMGALIENAIDRAVKALFENDGGLAVSAMEFDTEVDRKERDIEGRCLRLLLQQQPVAKDLRTISAALKMVTDMERIGDQAADIAEITLRLGGTVNLQKVHHINSMAKAAIKMVKESIDAFVSRNMELAQKVIDSDDIVDNYFNEVRDDLIRIVKNDAANAEAAIDLLMIAKYFERIGDHAVNIGEWVVYSITGVHKSAELTEPHPALAGSDASADSELQE